MRNAMVTGLVYFPEISAEYFRRILLPSMLPSSRSGIEQGYPRWKSVGKRTGNICILHE